MSPIADQPVLECRGARMPALGFGTYRLEGEECYRMVRAALDIGYRHIDTARIYGNEAEVGRALFDSKVPLEEVFLTTKLWRDDLSRDGMRSGAEAALRDLGVTQVDLLLIHWPNDAYPLKESLETLAELREEGRARFVGLSNYPSAGIREAIDVLGADLICDQVEYHLLLSQERLLETLRERDMILTAYRPLAGGVVLDEPQVQAVADKHGVTPAQIALAWLLHQPGVAAIPKTASEKRARENFEALGVRLEDEDLRRLSETPKDMRQIDPGFAPEWDEE